MSLNLLGVVKRPFVSLFGHFSTPNAQSRASSSSRVSPRAFPTTGFTNISSEKVEEENWDWYTPSYFYPVHIGEVLGSRYQVLYKLGYGTTSTSWMCRDLNYNTYVCVKSVCQNHPSFQQEIDAYETLSQAVTASPVQKGHLIQSVRQTLDHFQVRRGDMDYSFLVQEPLGVSLETMLRFFGQLPINMVHTFAANFLCTLDAIHACGVIHAGTYERLFGHIWSTILRAILRRRYSDNIFSRIQDETLFHELEEDEIANPSPRKRVTEDATIFATKQVVTDNGGLRRWFGDRSDLVLSNFGEARHGKSFYRENTPSEAPEVLMRVAWTETLDIWSFGCLLWEIATGEHLFPRGPRNESDPNHAVRVQLATMVALLGAPPKDLLDMYQTVLPDAPNYFNEDGSPIAVVPEQTLESRLASALEGKMFVMTLKQQEAFVAFLRRVLVWHLKRRPSASVLLQDRWIVGEFEGQ